MIARIVAFSARHSAWVVAVALVLALAGEVARRTLSRDAIPDLSDPQIVLVVDWMGHSATEVAENVTQVLTASLDGVPGATAVRGLSMSGMAYIDVVFDSPSALARGRDAIAQRVAIESEKERLPATARVEVGPLASSTGWVFEYALVDPRRRQSAVALRAIQEDILRPALAAIPGVVEVASVGEGVQDVLVELEADRLRARSVAVTDVVGVVRNAITTHQSATPNELSLLSVGGPDAGEPIRVGDVGRVHVTGDMPLGIADFRGIQPAIGGIVVAARNADVPAVTAAVERALEEQRAKLPAGVELITAYDRSDLITGVWRTLLRALGEEVGVVVAVVLLFLLSGRSALVALLTLPVVLLLTFGGMRLLGVQANITSLGGIGIALGMAVDADVVALEACHRRLEALDAAATTAERRDQLIAAAGSFAPAILTSLVIAGLAFLPVLAFGGETGRLLRPLALAKTLVIAAAALVALTLAPALRHQLLRGSMTPEFSNPVTRGLVEAYRPFVHFALRRPWLTLLTAAFAVLSCVPIATRLGGDFLPRVDEGDLLFMPTTLPGAPADLAATELFQQDQALRGFPEVAAIFGKVGRADTATDPAPFSMAETTLRLAPRGDWPLVQRARWYSRWAPVWIRPALGLIWPEATRETLPELIAKLDGATRLPGWVNAWTAPARARMDMMETEVRTPVGIRVVATSPERLDALGTRLRALVATFPGTRGAVFESLGGEPRLALDPDQDAMRRAGVDPGVVRATANLLISGGQVGDVERGGHRLRVRVSPDVKMSTMMPEPQSLRGPADELRNATVRAASGAPVPLGLLGRVRYAIEPAMLRAEKGERVAYIHVDLTEGTDLSRYVEAARSKVAAALATGEIELQPGERIDWTGQYEILEAGRARLHWIIPLVALSMLGLLLLQFRSVVEALIVLVSVPFALVGSVWTLFLLGYSLSAPVWIGLLSVVGLAMQTGVVMVVYIDAAFHRRLREGLIRTRDDIVAAHAEGTVLRLRPKVMTITTMAASLLPLLWADGAGADIMRRVAAPMIGGLATSAFLTLEVLPVLYTLWRQHQLRRSVRLGVPLEVVVGSVPDWARQEE